MDYVKHDRLVTIYSFLIEAMRLILNVSLNQRLSRDSKERLCSILGGALDTAKRLQEDSD